MERTCVGCREAGDPTQLVRLVLGPDGDVAPVLAGGSFGRGAWVHPRPACLSQAVPKGLARALRGEVKVDARGVAELLRSAARKRFFALVASSRRAGKAQPGATLAKIAFDGHALKLLVVAADARAAATGAWVDQVFGAGHALVFGTKAELGSCVGGDEVGVLAILDDGLAAALRQAHGVAMLEDPPARAGGANELMTEVR